MKISFVKPVSNISILNNYKKQTFCGVTTNTQKDIFIKSQNISFGSGKFSDLCTSMRKDICDYVLNSEQILNKDIEDIIQKYCPDVTVEEFNQEDHETYQIAAFSERMEGHYDENNRIRMVSLGKKIKIAPYDKAAPNARLQFAEQVVHETAHAIQQDCKDRVSEIDFYNNYFASEKDNTKAVNTFTVSKNAYLNTEFDLFICESITSPYKDKTIEGINQAFMKKFGNSAKDEFKSRIQNNLNALTEHIGDNYNKKFVLEYIAYEAQDEIDAYTQEMITGKNHSLKSRILLYGILIQAAKDLASEL